MSGVYIHIPFCRSKCDYCNFFSLASQQGRGDVADGICREIMLRSEYLGSEKISSIYFGGGTPSLLPVKDIEDILKSLNKCFNMATDIEITLEANPDDISKEKLCAYRELGINRISIGIQSFFPSDLNYLSRKHNPGHAHNAIENTLEAGFTNIGIDLIFGLPTQDITKLEKNLEIFKQYKIPHLSAYALTLEPNTALAWKINKKMVNPVIDEDQTEQFLFLMDWMESQAYLQYEISNYSLPGYESKHNSAYWNREKYLGLGPSAHSFDGVSRQWNVAELTKYLHGLGSGKPFFEKEVLTTAQHQNEYVMTALRTNKGIDKSLFVKWFGEVALTQLRQNIHILTCCQGASSHSEWIKDTDTQITLTRQGKLFTDHIASELFRQDC